VIAYLIKFARRKPGIDDDRPGADRLAARSNPANEMQFSLTIIIRSPALMSSDTSAAEICPSDRSSSR